MWPVLTSLFGETCALNMDRAEMGLPARDRLFKFHSCGNGMAFPQMGFALLFYHMTNVDTEMQRPEFSSLMRRLGATLSQGHT